MGYNGKCTWTSRILLPALSLHSRALSQQSRRRGRQELPYASNKVIWQLKLVLLPRCSNNLSSRNNRNSGRLRPRRQWTSLFFALCFWVRIPTSQDWAFCCSGDWHRWNHSFSKKIQYLRNGSHKLMLNNRLNISLIIPCSPALVLIACQVKVQNSMFQICSKEWEVKRRPPPC